MESMVMVPRQRESCSLMYGRKVLVIIEKGHCRLILVGISQVYGDVVLLLFIVLVLLVFIALLLILGWDMYRGVCNSST
jgi:hypothetical protein